MSDSKFVIDNDDDIGVDSSDSSESEGKSENGNDLDDFELTEEHLSVKADNVPLTPFNMKEELEEGHFDSEGMYHWKKKDKIKDFWVDNIDRAPLCSAKIKAAKESSEEGTSYLDEVCNTIDIFKKILCYLQPKETIAQSLRRLGKGNTLTPRERWRRKKLGTLVNSDDSEKISELTGLANKLLTETGDYDIYSKTYEEIAAKIASPQTIETGKVPTLDMFSDDEEDASGAENKCSIPLSKAPTLNIFSEDSDETKEIVLGGKSNTSLAKMPTLDMFSDDAEEIKVPPKEDIYSPSLPKKPRLDTSNDDTTEKKENPPENKTSTPLIS